MYPLGCSPHRVRVPKNAIFASFGGKRPLNEKILLRKDLAGHRSTCSSENFVKIGRREVGEIVRGCVDRKKSSFLGTPRDVFRRPSAAPEPIAPKFLHTTFPLKYFVLAEFHPPRLSFGGVMPPTPSGASLHYGLPYTL